MRKQDLTWIAVVLVLLIWRCTSMFSGPAKKDIQIVATLRPLGNGGRMAAGAPLPVLFELDDYYKLTSVEAVEDNTNSPGAAPHTLWRLVPGKGARPKVKIFFYGQKIDGMDLEPPVDNPEALTLNVPYRLNIKVGSLKGSVAFHTAPKP